MNVFSNLASCVGMDSDMTHSPKLRFGLIGCGGVGPTHAGALLRIEGAELVATADVIKERAQDLAAKLNLAKFYATDEALIADPDIDVVCICTPSGMHADHSVRAARAA